MVSKAIVRLSVKRLASIQPAHTFLSQRTIASQPSPRTIYPLLASSSSRLKLCNRPRSSPAFHTSSSHRAQLPTADALMESLTELYSTARDEFEIAAEETEKKTVYAADDREAAVEALNMLKEGFNKALKETSPEVAKEIQSRVGQRIRELENAVKAMEEMAMED